VVFEYATLLKSYGLSRVTGDRYAGEWVSSAFRKHGISYAASEKAKSDIYLEAEPLFARGAARVVDHRGLQVELRQLERRTTGSGKDRIDHPPRGHDDAANAACGALWLSARERVAIGTGDIFFMTLEEVRDERIAAIEARMANRPALWDI
jgi:hypothetical protein